MKTLLKIVLGIVTTLPLVLILYSFLESSGLIDVPSLHRIMRNFELWIFFGTVFLVLLYIIMLFNSDRLKPDTKSLWAVLFLVTHIVAMPVYFYVNIWSERDELTS